MRSSLTLKKKKRGSLLSATWDEPSFPGEPSALLPPWGLKGYLLGLNRDLSPMKVHCAVQIKAGCLLDV